MRKIILTVFFLFPVFIAYSTIELDDVRTTLVVIEEKENQEPLKEGSPVSDGIFDALWKYNDYIFFDIKVDNPINIVNNTLDASPYIDQAKKTGADSILLIKFYYTSEKNQTGSQLKIGNVNYNLFSVKKLKSLSLGEINLNINRHVDTQFKSSYLKQVGYDFLSKIYGG